MAWFGPEFVSEHLRQFDHLSPEQRQLTYDIAVEDAFEPWRRWLSEQLVQLPEVDAEALAGRLWLDEHFWTVNFELAAGAWLRDQGLTVVYEQSWGGQTPDWTVLSDDGRPLGFVEVHTNNPAPDTYGRMRAWHGLVKRIMDIPVPVVLRLVTNDLVDPPGAGTAKRIAKELRSSVLARPEGPFFHSCGYRFAVVRDRYGQAEKSPFGLRAVFDPPSEISGAVSAQPLLKRVEKKVRKYREIVVDHEASLTVAVGAHRFTGVELRHLDEALKGSNAPIINLQFNAGDPPVEQVVNWAPVEPWVMPSGLTELLWIDNKLPFTVTRRPNPMRPN